MSNPRRCPKGSTPALLERLTEAAFGQRRKMLRQSLKGVPGAVDALGGDRRRIRNAAPRP